jgi:Spy/CpxP family protein refolding chaperone
MKKWQIVILAVLFMGLGTTVFAFGPPFGGGAPFAGNPGFGGPFGGTDGLPGPTTPVGPGRFRQGFGPGFGTGFGPVQYLNLSEDQLNKMGSLRDRYLQETRDLRYAIAQQQLEVQRLFTDPKTDEATLSTKQKELITLRQQLFNKMAQMPLEMRKVLTPEQIQKLGQMPMGYFRGGPAMMGFGARGWGM